MLNPVGLTRKNFLNNLFVQAEGIALNQQVVLAQLRSAEICQLSSFLGQYHGFFEGPLYNPCWYGIFKLFFGLRKCVDCPCEVKSRPAVDQGSQAAAC